jgi:hypothetical protein
MKNASLLPFSSPSIRAFFNREVRRPFSIPLEIDTRTNLTGAAAAEIGAPCTGDLAHAGAVDGEHRVGEIDVIQHVGEGGFNLDADSFGNREVLGHTGVQIHRVRADDRPDPGVAEAANGVACAVADKASRAGGPTRSARAGEGSGVEPAAGRGITEVWTTDDIGSLFTPDVAGTGARGIAAAEVGGKKGAGLKQEDAADLPATDDGIGYTVEISAELTATTHWQFIDERGNPAVAARAGYRTILSLQVISIHGAGARVFPGERKRTVARGVARIVRQVLYARSPETHAISKMA